MSNIFVHATPHFYADDTQIYLKCKPEDLSRGINFLNEDLNRITEWTAFNGLSINARKTQSIIFSRIYFDLSSLSPVVLNGTPIDFVEKVNNLGITLKSDLSWNEEVMNNAKSIYYGLRCLWNHSGILPKDTKMKLVKSLLCPFLTISDVVTGELNSANLSCLQKSFNSIIRFVYSLGKYDHISHLSSSIVGLPLRKFLCFRRMVFLYNLIKNKEPLYLHERLVPCRSSRLGLTFIIPNHHYAPSGKSFFINDVIFWNGLPPYIRKASTIKEFKDKLKEYLNN